MEVTWQNWRKNVELNLQHPYKYIKVANLEYYFTTKHGIEYHVYFICADNMHPVFNESYWFNIEPTDRRPHPIDCKIAVTIVHILKEFFTNHERSMLMVCDTIDGKQQKRRKLFNRWYKRFNTGELLAFNAMTENDDYTLHVSLYVMKNNCRMREIIDAFYELAKNDLYPMD